MKYIINQTKALSLIVMACSFISLSTQALEVGEQAPCVVLTGIEPNGREAERCIREPLAKSQCSEEKGTRYTVLKFFSVFCEDCRQMHAQFTNLAQRDSSLFENASIHYIGIDRQSALIRQYAKDEARQLSALKATTFIDSDRDAKSAYNSVSTPTVFVLDRKPQGGNKKFTITYKHVGPMDQVELSRFLSSIK